MKGIYYRDRLDAAEQLIPLLKDSSNSSTIVLAIPRGAVPMGFHIAKSLNVPFDILLVKKIGYPGNPELAVGSVSVEGRIIDPEFAVRREYIDTETKRIQAALKERLIRLRGNLPAANLRGKKVIIIDDGIATGNSMMAAVSLVRKQFPHTITVAVPVASPRALNKVEKEVDEIICLHAPEDFMAVAEYYSDFSVVTDDDVEHCMKKEMEREKVNHLSR